MKLSVAIVGRPNVGKSTLFNRLAGRRLALVAPMPGLTRDRREAELELGEHTLTLIDTAGLEDAERGSIAERMRAQSELAIAGADLVLFVIDARAGLTPADEGFAALVRAAGKPALVVTNKSEGRSGDAGYYEAFRLGFGDPVAISAEHGEGMGELYVRMNVAIEALLNEPGPPLADTLPGEPAAAIKVAVIGRPNAGKSTLVNALLGEDRVITGPEPGLTRDAIALDLEWGGRAYQLFDTAGLRRRARVSEEAEKLSVGDALRAIRFAEVVIILLEPTRALEKQDLHIAALAAEEGRAIVIALNKWDLVTSKTAQLKAVREAVDRLIPQIRGVGVVPISALARQGLDRLMREVVGAHERWNKRLSTGVLNRWLADAVAAYPPPAPGGRRLKLRFMTQPGARPPRFVVFCSRPKEVPQSYERYLLNGLRDQFGFAGTPLRMFFRAGKNPYQET
jgi:GTP-binding protein